MPVIYRCNCGRETTNPHGGWLIKPQIGGTKVMCPDCKIKDDLKNNKPNKNLDRAIKLLNERGIK